MIRCGLRLVCCGVNIVRIVLFSNFSVSVVGNRLSSIVRCGV